MKKKFLGATFAIMCLQISKAEEEIILTSPMLDLIDGKSYAINGEVYGLILQVRREIRRRLFGTRNKNGQFFGSYEFDGQLYSIAELSTLEAQREEEFTTRSKELKQSKHLYSKDAWEQAVQQLEQIIEEKKQQMRETLEAAKDDLLNITTGYIDSCRGFKEQIMELILESCERRNNKKCFLLKWGEEKEGKEGELLKAELITFKGFEKFCIDLTHYLEDMARSCPEGKKQFIALLKQKKIRF